MNDRKLNGCRQRVLFARRLIPPQCSLCSQGMCSPVFLCFPLFSPVSPSFPLFSPVFPCFLLFCSFFSWFLLFLPVFPCFLLFSPGFLCFLLFSPVFYCSPLFSPVFPFPLFSPVFPCFLVFSSPLFSYVSPVFSCFPTFSCFPLFSPASLLFPMFNLVFLCFLLFTYYIYSNFLRKDQLTKKKERIVIKDVISDKWKYSQGQKKQGWFYSREYIIFKQIFLKARPSFFKVLHIMRRYNLKIRE